MAPGVLFLTTRERIAHSILPGTEWNYTLRYTLTNPTLPINIFNLQLFLTIKSHGVSIAWVILGLIVRSNGHCRAQRMHPSYIIACTYFKTFKRTDRSFRITIFLLRNLIRSLNRTELVTIQFCFEVGSFVKILLVWLLLISKCCRLHYTWSKNHICNPG